MKIRYRVLLYFLVIILLLVFTITLLNRFFLQGQLQDREARRYATYAGQTLTNFELLANEISQNLFNAYSYSAIPELLSENATLSNKQNNVGSQLRFICLNSPYITSILVEDLEANHFYGSEIGATLMPPDYMVELLTSGAVALQSRTQWVANEAGLYLKMDINSVFPLKCTGLILAKMDGAYFRSALGMDSFSEGFISILGAGGENLLMNQEAEPQLLADAAAAADTAVPYALFSQGGEEYCIIMDNSSSGRFAVLALIPRGVLLDAAIVFNRLSLLAAVIVGLIALFLAVLLSGSLTKGLRVLWEKLQMLSDGSFDVEISVTGKDEISQLTRKFNWMVSQLQDMTRRIVVEATEKQRSEYEMLELKYRSLQAQVSPHFLCNILAGITALSAMGERKKVELLSVQASRYLRINLNSNENKYVLLREEIQSLEEYVLLYRLIYETPFTFFVQIPPEADEVIIPNMILQPLVENALTHGAKNLDGTDPNGQLHIEITAKIEAGRLLLSVRDNGAGFDPRVIAELKQVDDGNNFDRKHSGFGTNSVLQRIRLLYKEDYRFDIISTPAEGSLIWFDLPLLYSKEEDNE